MAWTKEEQYAYIEKYQKENVRRVVVKLNKKTDADILKHLESISNIQGYIKSLIRADIDK